jgi:anti-sigma B factor antagonist
MNMEMIVDELGSVTNVAMKGRLDAKGAESVDLPLSVLAGSKTAVILDLSEVDFLASLGIRTLLTAAKAVQRKGGKLVIVAPEGNVRMVLQTAGMETLIPMYPDRAAAVAALSA